MDIRTAIGHLHGPIGSLSTLMYAVLFVGCSGGVGTDDAGVTSPASRQVELPGAYPTTCAELGHFVAKELGGLSTQALGPEGVGISLQYRPALLRSCMVDKEAALHDVIKAMETGATDSWVVKVPRTIPGTDSTTSSAFMEYLFRSSGAKQDIVMVIGTDTVPCSFLHLEGTPSVSRHHQLLIGFDVPEDHRQRKMIWKGPEELMGAPIHFEFREGIFSRYHDLASTIRPN
jgi:hypothetical protein